MRILAIFLAGSALAAAPALAQTSAPAPATAPATAPVNVTVGATVVDTANAPVGTIEAVANGAATISTGTTKAALPLTAFAQGPNGLVIAMTRADLEAAVASAKPAEIAVGATVSGPQGGKVGTVESVSGDLVTVATATTKVQLPKKAFAQGPDGLVIGMTAEQLDAAAKAAAPKKG